jgi:recombination protein RecR
MKYPRAIQNLIAKLSDLPSVGPKTAERYVFYLLKQPAESLKTLATALLELKEKTTLCGLCQAVAETDPCPICHDKNRHSDLLCIVENTQDLATIEATKQYSGRYFVLAGLINTINDVKPADLNIDKLVNRIKTSQIKEVILALNFTLEGETTALYLTKILKDHLKITRLAKGLPAGSDLEYADELTLASALKNRNEVK